MFAPHLELIKILQAILDRRLSVKYTFRILMGCATAYANLIFPSQYSLTRTRIGGITIDALYKTKSL